MAAVSRFHRSSPKKRFKRLFKCGASCIVCSDSVFFPYLFFWLFNLFLALSFCVCVLEHSDWYERECVQKQLRFSCQCFYSTGDGYRSRWTNFRKRRENLLSGVFTTSSSPRPQRNLWIVINFGYRQNWFCEMKHARMAVGPSLRVQLRFDVVRRSLWFWGTTDSLFCAFCRIAFGFLLEHLQQKPRKIVKMSPHLATEHSGCWL